jgi:DNA-binding response OmpR family regulator
MKIDGRRCSIYELFTARSRLFNPARLHRREAAVAVETTTDSGGTLHVGELEIRLGEGLVLATGQALTLSVREFALLAALAAHAGAIVTREELFGEVWGGELRPGDRSVDVYVSKLRGKLEAALPDRRFIHTHPGFGYRFQPQPAREGLAASAQTASEPIAGVSARGPDERSDAGHPENVPAA